MTLRRSATTSTDARLRMVERQLRRRGITDTGVLRAMEEVPRERFVTRGDELHAYRDGALRIGSGQTISQPWVVAFMTSLLGLRGDETVLEVGTGSGYGAAVLSRCAGEVITIERHPPLAARAQRTLSRAGLRQRRGARGRRLPGRPGPRPVRRHLRHRHGRRRAARRPARAARRPAPRSCARCGAVATSASCGCATAVSRSSCPCASCRSSPAWRAPPEARDLGRRHRGAPLPGRRSSPRSG